MTHFQPVSLVQVLVAKVMNAAADELDQRYGPHPFVTSQAGKEVVQEIFQSTVGSYPADIRAKVKQQLDKILNEVAVEMDENHRKHQAGQL